ncbi:SusC/RagA family TonB-linked outer membrane protein [Capnocytophaga leadbetteri]
MKSIISILILLFSIPMLAQKVNISGVVVDENQQPLPGASVTIEHAQKGTATDLDGRFSLEVTPTDKIVVSYIGYQAKTIAVGKPRTFKVSLYPEVTQMEEVVVVGYGTQRKNDISTAVASVKMADIAQSSPSQVLQALQGKVSGVQIISSDGSATSGLTFRIRGVNSITGGTQPLFVIDGVPMPTQRVTNTNQDVATNPLLGLNPSDIESMEILKDAAAAAIYGSNGSNGVVLITTKKGKELAKPKFNFSYASSIEMMPSIPLKVLSAEDYTHKMLNYATWDNVPVTQFWQRIIAQKEWQNPAVKDWLQEVTQTGTKNEANGSIMGGTEQTRYMLSVGYMNQEGLIKRSAFNRFTSRLNLSQKINSKVNAGINLSYAVSKDKNPVSDWSQNGVVLRALQTSPFLYYPGFSTLMSYPNIRTMSPKVAVDQVDINTKYNELNANVYLSYQVLKDLTFNTSASYRLHTIGQDRFWGPDTWFGQSERGRMELSNRNENSWVYEARLQYSKSIDKHYFSVMGAFEANKYSTDYTYNKSTNFEDTKQGIWGINQGLVTYAPLYTYDGNQLVSYISRATYSYNNKYVANASLRADGSSKFGKNNKYGYFPALSLAWNAHEEAFIKKIDAISNLRLRSSFGMTGNNQIPSYQSLAQLAKNKVVLDGNKVEIGRYTSNIANDNLKWESQKQYNIGVDLSLFKNRYSLSTELYYKRIDDMLLEVNIPSTSGFQKAWKNAGSMENKGLEVSLNAQWLREGDFKWTTDFNISFYRNKILSLDEGQYQQFYDRGINSKIKSDVLLRVGMPVGIYYGYVADGVFHNQNEVDNAQPGPNVTLGGLRVKDINADGVIDTNDRVPVANVNPLHTGGIGNTFSYKGFELYAFLRWSYGNDVVNGNAYYLTGTKNIDNITQSVYNNVWSAQHPERNFPLFGGGFWAENAFRSDLVEDGSFLRLQTLTLSYNLPKTVIDPYKLSKLRVGVTGTNLAIWTRYSGFDPEANTGYGTIARLAPGLDMSPYPRPTSVLFSVELGF